MGPYNHSEESVKEKCAACQQPFVSPTKQQEPNSWPVANWEETRACLSAILRSASSPGPEPGVITVSNVKRLFRSRFGLDLSETALGYSRLSELLQDPRLRDICTVQIQNAGQFVVHRAALPMPARASGLQPSSNNNSNSNKQQHRPPPGLHAPGFAAPGLKDAASVPWNEPRSVRTNGPGCVWGSHLSQSPVWDAQMPGVPMHVVQGLLNPPPPPALPVMPPGAGGSPPCFSLGTSPVPPGALSPPTAVDAFGAMSNLAKSEHGEGDIEGAASPACSGLELTSINEPGSGGRSAGAGASPCIIPPPGLSLPVTGSVDPAEQQKGLNEEGDEQDCPGEMLTAQLAKLFDEWDNSSEPLPAKDCQDGAYENGKAAQQDHHRQVAEDSALGGWLEVSREVVQSAGTANAFQEDHMIRIV